MAACQDSTFLDRPVHVSREVPLSKPLTESRGMTPEEFQLSQVPDNLHEKQFQLSLDTEDTAMYEITGFYRKKKNKILMYEVILRGAKIL
jgi:hypothetical protein